MRVVLDTKILISALISSAGNPAIIYNAWEVRRRVCSRSTAQGTLNIKSCSQNEGVASRGSKTASIVMSTLELTGSFIPFAGVATPG